MAIKTFCSSCVRTHEVAGRDVSAKLYSGDEEFEVVVTQKYDFPLLSYGWFEASRPAYGSIQNDTSSTYSLQSNSNQQNSILDKSLFSNANNHDMLYSLQDNLLEHIYIDIEHIYNKSLNLSLDVLDNMNGIGEDKNILNNEFLDPEDKANADFNDSEPNTSDNGQQNEIPFDNLGGYPSAGKDLNHHKQQDTNQTVTDILTCIEQENTESIQLPENAIVETARFDAGQHGIYTESLQDIPELCNTLHEDMFSQDSEVDVKVYNSYSDLEMPCSDDEGPVQERSLNTMSIDFFNCAIKSQNLKRLAFKLFLKSVSESNNDLQLSPSGIRSEDTEPAKLGIHIEGMRINKVDENTVKRKNRLDLENDFAFLKKKQKHISGFSTPKETLKSLASKCSLIQSHKLKSNSSVMSTGDNPIKSVNYSSVIRNKSARGTINSNYAKSRSSVEKAIMDLSNAEQRHSTYYKKVGSSLDYNTRRGILSNNILSSDSGKAIKNLSGKHGSDDKVFGSNNEESDWCSEMWDSFINVITCRRLKIGHGSFSTVSEAILRSYPSMLSRTGRDADIEMFNKMLELISGHCELCKNTVKYKCAVKSIGDGYPLSRFQYIREKEMMLHFNAHVLKPLSCRVLNDNSCKVYQLLMPRARGDLLTMINGLIKHRTKKGYGIIKLINHKSEKRIIGLFEDEVRFLFLQILSGLSFIQMCFQGDIYRHSDIKLANILVFCEDENIYIPFKWKLALADFGCSILINPTQHLDGSTSFKGLHHSLLKEWTQQLSSQLLSFVRGTVRYNAPEALSYDRNGTKRSNHNPNCISIYKKNHKTLSSIINSNKVDPVSWGLENVDPISSVRSNPSNKISGASENDVAEYFRVDMRADMWSAGIILAELSKFGCNLNISTMVNKSNPDIFESILKSFEGKETTDVPINGEKIKSKIASTLGRGLFCRNTMELRKRLAASKGTPLQHPISDDELNKILASEISSECDVDLQTRIKNLKALFPSFENCKFTSGFWDLLARLLAYNPSDRLMAPEALGHYWFKNSAYLFDIIDDLPCSTFNHLPLQHFYYTKLQIASNGSQINDSSPLKKCEEWLDFNNSDMCFNSLFNYAKVSQTPHAWFSGPVHYRLHKLQSQNIHLPDMVAHICTREACILETREKEIFGSEGYILSRLLDIKSKYNLSWERLLSSHTAHLLGQTILSERTPKIL
ncbi:hypothetical protein BEWA_038060 [Theileria equi strain WA]|uniref:Protein kinase domain-containing protein n=1 Tax=Theileria equi strain WA TaxID=1537102 RepID=L1LES8_THEEQ|nr:hypothetical protein BEWA_038060 [Theileria equi strain WA]EKX73769.1 hypothetical protein BEWA_038060 [Theileria equi strain WA]|eukprot:XP_004833221.1 hypothetical protein BEWA_038060 [Theileria equi strain WA]